jgi:hypothetical protein
MALINEGGKLLLQNGALASGSGCCCGGACECATSQITGKTFGATVTVTIPESDVDCPGGTHTATFELQWQGQFQRYFFCQQIVLGSTSFFDPETEQEFSFDTNGSVAVFLVCQEDGSFLSGAYFYASNDCFASVGYTCTIGNGNFIGVGPEEGEFLTHATSTQNGQCVPQGGSASYTNAATGVTVEWTITVA